MVAVVLALVILRAVAPTCGLMVNGLAAPKQSNALIVTGKVSTVLT